MKKIICDYCQLVINKKEDGAIIWHEKVANGKWDFAMVIHKRCDLKFTRMLHDAHHRMLPLEYAIHPNILGTFEGLLEEPEYQALRDRLFLTEKYH